MRSNSIGDSMSFDLYIGSGECDSDSGYFHLFSLFILFLQVSLLRLFCVCLCLFVAVLTCAWSCG